MIHFCSTIGTLSLNLRAQELERYGRCGYWDKTWSFGGATKAFVLGMIFVFIVARGFLAAVFKMTV